MGLALRRGEAGQTIARDPEQSGGNDLLSWHFPGAILHLNPNRSLLLHGAFVRNGLSP
jgi:hypothetical protein